MKLRDDQQNDLLKPQQEEFIKDLKRFLRDNYPDDVGHLDPLTFDKRVRWGIERARSHGLTWAYSISVFVTTMVVAGPNFDQSPPVRACLEDPSAEPNERTDLMRKRVTDEQWDELRQRSRQRDWAVADAQPDRMEAIWEE